MGDQLKMIPCLPLEDRPDFQSPLEESHLAAWALHIPSKIETSPNYSLTTNKKLTIHTCLIFLYKGITKKIKSLITTAIQNETNYSHKDK